MAKKTLPTREELAGNPDHRAVPVVPEQLADLFRAIQSGEYDPAAHVQAVIARNQEAARLRREEEATYEALASTPAEPYRGKDTPFKEVLWLKADTWDDYRLFDVPAMQHDGVIEAVDDWQAHTVRCPGTNFYYANKTLPVSYSLATAVTRKQQGKVFFDGPITTPVLFEQMGVEEDFRQRVWMGLTPMEAITQKKGIDRARGHVVVGGLGLGWFLKEIAAKPEVRSIVVVEKNAALLAWVRAAIEEKYPAVAAKVKEWIPADVYQYIIWDMRTRGYPHAGWDLRDDPCYLLDIWPLLGDADYDHTYVQLENWLGDRIWGWGRGATYGGEPVKLDITKPLPYPRSYLRKKPCSGCPFSRTSEPGKGGTVDPLRLIGQAQGAFMLPCHQEPGYKEEKQGDVYQMAQCAGAATYRSNIGIADKYPAAFHTLPADCDRVFATPAELLAGYNKIPLEEAERMLRETTPEQLLKQELARASVRVYGRK